VENDTSDGPWFNADFQSGENFCQVTLDRDGQYVSYIRKLRKLQHKFRNFHVYDDPRFG